jgi:hypothetical protein
MAAAVSGTVVAAHKVAEVSGALPILAVAAAVVAQEMLVVFLFGAVLVVLVALPETLVLSRVVAVARLLLTIPAAATAGQVA